jgi:hypothetical protein
MHSADTERERLLFEPKGERIATEYDIWRKANKRRGRFGWHLG